MAGRSTPTTTDTATSGAFERAIPQKTKNGAGVKQAKQRIQRSIRAGNRRGGRASAGLERRRRRHDLCAIAGVQARQRELDRLDARLPVHVRPQHKVQVGRLPAHPRQRDGGVPRRGQQGKPERRRGHMPRSASTRSPARRCALTVQAADGATDSLVEAAVDDVGSIRPPEIENFAPFIGPPDVVHLEAGSRLVL